MQTNRLTVGMVKSLLDFLHRSCTRDAIMIPYKAWSMDTWSIDLGVSFDLTWVLFGHGIGL